MVLRLKNHLGEQSSLYLRQHAEDPVDWYPWGQEALDLARNQNKPIFLSIGYSACHWCHVMAEESFQDAQTARWMNQYFICIKVDAQERPDLDKVYQTAYQLMHQQPGGWPLTAILTPMQHLPFFIGTYFPKVSTAGMPSFLDVITQIAHYYQQHSSTLDQHQAPLLTAFSILNETMRQPTIDSMNDRPLTIARIEWEGDYDEGYAGFGSSPKFPHPSFLNGLMYYWYLTKVQNEEDSNALKMVSTTLDKMASSGLYDHIGGGFFRYAIDEAWKIPHFEKMLYDNAQLLTLYVQAYQSIVDPVFKRVGQEVAAWLLKEGLSPEGGFYATWDADTEEGEGAYYVWQRSEIQNILTVEEYTIIENHWDLTKPANFKNNWHLQNGSAVIELAIEYKKSIQFIEKTIGSARQKLLSKRQERVAPICDKKILISWNALTIKALCHAAMVFENEEYQLASEKTLKFIYENMWIEGRLYTAYEEGRCATKAYLEDYAHLLDALLQYLQLQWNSEYFDWAIILANQLLDLFEDDERGGFYFTGNDQEILLFRPKPFAEDSTPSGNGIAAQCLLVLGYLLGDVRYLTAAEKTLRVSDYHLHHQAEIHGSLLIALDYYLRPPEIITLRGDGAEMKLWKDLSQKEYNPRRFVFSIPQNTEGLCAALHRKMPDKKTIVAYICDGIQCSKPILDFDSYKEKIKIL